LKWLLKQRLALALIWTLGLLYALFSPSDNVPDLPKFPGADKLIHFTLFFGMSFLWLRVIKVHSKNNKNNFFTNYLVLWIFLAIFTEYLQLLVPGRSFDYLDIGTNILGGTIGTVIYVYLNKRSSILV